MIDKLLCSRYRLGKIVFGCIGILMFFSFSNAMAQSDKKITVNLNNVSIRTALRQLEKAAQVYFMYDESTIDIHTKISLFHTKAGLRVVLDDFCKQTSLRYEIKKNVVLILPAVSTKKTGKQYFRMTGMVRDESGEAIAGASVAVAGTTKGTVTDEKGVYDIEVQSGDLLVFTFIGMTDKVIRAEADKKNVDVKLVTTASALADVVVTGYQTLSKERATGSFDKVDSRIIEARPAADLSVALQGVVAGMQSVEKEDGTVDFRIRGTGSLYADKKPLLVVDGFPVYGDFSSINPNDVKSVTVLKDAAAASIWGARSANGVIVVTTKKGRKDGIDIAMKAFVRIGTTPDLDYILNQADSRTMVDYEMRALENNWKISRYEYSPTFSKIRNSLTLAQELYYANKYGKISEQEMLSGLERLRNTDNREDLKKYMMQTSLLQQYNISISGGTGNMSNYLSLMYEKNQEHTIKRGYGKYMLNYNNSFKFTDRLKANITTTLQHKEQETSGMTLDEFTVLSPYELLLNEDSSYAANLHYYNRSELAKLPLDKLPYKDWSYNMLREVRVRDYKSTAAMYRIQVGLNAKITKGLNYDMRLQYESAKIESKKHDDEETFYTRNMVNMYTEYNSALSQVGISRLPKGGILRNEKTENTNYVFRNQLNYTGVFQNKHEISVVGGLEISQYEAEKTVYPYVYGYDALKNTSSVPPYGYGSAVDGFKDFFGNSVTIEGGDTPLVYRCDRYVSYYTNMGYMYEGRYGISFSARGDASNFVSDDPALRWAPMWSLGAKWNISKEKFMANLLWIDYLNLRLTYGINGNAEKTTSPLTLITLNSSVDPRTGTVVGKISGFGNPRLRWEKTHTMNIGIDFNLFNEVLAGKLDVYNRNSKDVIGLVSIPNAYGTATQKLNNAEILNRGVELELSTKCRFPSVGVGIKSTLTYAYNYNKILRLYHPALYCSQLVKADTHVEGKPIGSIYSYEFLGMKEGVPYVLGANGDEISMNQAAVHSRSFGLDILHYSGSVISPHTMGWTNYFTWKNFGLHVFITAKFGGVFRAPTTGTVPIVGSGKTFVGKSIRDFANSDGTKYPTWPLKDETGFYLWDRYMPNLTYFVQNASFIRLKEINLEYDLPKDLVGRLRMKGAKLFVQIRNLGLIYTRNEYGYDPEWLPGTNKPSAAMAFGANVNF